MGDCDAGRKQVCSAGATTDPLIGKPDQKLGKRSNIEAPCLTVHTKVDIIITFVFR